MHGELWGMSHQTRSSWAKKEKETTCLRVTCNLSILCYSQNNVKKPRSTKHVHTVLLQESGSTITKTVHLTLKQSTGSSARGNSRLDGSSSQSPTPPGSPCVTKVNANRFPPHPSGVRFVCRWQAVIVIRSALFLVWELQSIDESSQLCTILKNELQPNRFTKML